MCENIINIINIICMKYNMFLIYTFYLMKQTGRYYCTTFHGTIITETSASYSDYLWIASV